VNPDDDDGDLGRRLTGMVGGAVAFSARKKDTEDVGGGDGADARRGER
jgi:hypothetical protein